MRTSMMKTALLLCVSLVSTSSAQDLTVKGPSSGQIDAGRMFVIEITGNEVKPSEITCLLSNPAPDAEWRQYKREDGGVDFVSSTAYPNTYKFVIAYCFHDPKETTPTKPALRQATYELQVIGRPVTPEKPGTPGTPGDKPPVTPTETLTQWTYKTVLATAFSDPELKVHSIGLAVAYRNIADKIKNKNLTDKDSIITAQTLVNSAIVGGASSTWLPFWKALDLKLATMKLTSMDQFEQAWREIAKGFEDVAK